MKKDLSNYALFVRFLEQVLGEDYGVALFEADSFDFPVTETAAFEADRAMLKALAASTAELPLDFVCGFEGIKEHLANKKLAVFPIRTDDRKAEGYLVFSRREKQNGVRAVMEELMNVSDVPTNTNLSRQVNAVLKEKAESIYLKHRGKSAKLSKKAKLAMMEEMLEQGLPRVKNGMQIIAEITEIPISSLYRYLSEVLAE